MTKAPGTALRRVAFPILIIASLGLAAPSLAFDSGGNSGGNAAAAPMEAAAAAPPSAP